MNIAKDFCDCIVSWEVQENRKISSVVHCSYAQTKLDRTADGTGTLYMKGQDDSEMDMNPILLTPFLHPELTKPPYCDLKIFISPKLGIKFDRLVIISTAKIAEIYDRSGELLFSVRGEKIIRKTDKPKDDELTDKAAGSSKSQQLKATSRWFRKEYIPSIDTFEVLVRFSEHQIPNQLFIKYIGVKIIPFDWSAELGSFNISAPPITTTIGGSTGSISSNSIAVNSDKIVEAIQNLNTTIQILTTEIGFSNKGSNPHLATGCNLDASSAMKLRRPNSPMAPTGTTTSTNWTGPSSRRSSDIANLQSWLETRLATIEINFTKAIDQISARILKIENQHVAEICTQTESQTDPKYLNSNATSSELPSQTISSPKKQITCQNQLIF